MFFHLIILFIESLFFGFVMAAPVGPVGVLCIRRTLTTGWIAGFSTGLGVAAADGSYAVIASLGLASISQTLKSYEQPIRLVGGIILVVIGVAIYRSKPPTEKEDAAKAYYWQDFLSGLFLALTNPMTIFSFIALYVGLRIGTITQGSVSGVALFATGVFIGSSLWWVLLSQLTLRLREKVSARTLLLINKICGLVIFLFGVSTLVLFLIDRSAKI